MKITEVVCQILRIPSVKAKTASSQDSVLVRVRTDTGLEGIGEADSSPEVVKAIVDAPFSHNIACGLRQIARRREPARSRTALAEDVSPDDVLRPQGGRHHRDGRRRHGALGYQGQSIRPADPQAARRQAARAHSRLRVDPVRQERQARRARLPSAGSRRATRAVKFGWEPMGQSEKLDIELVKRCPRRTGRRCDAAGRRRLRVGCPHGPAPGQRVRRIQRRWLEEPLREDDIEGYVWLRDRSPIPIAAGEGECGRESFRPLIDRRALDVYQVDLSRCGFTDAAYIRRTRRGDRRLGYATTATRVP